MSPVAVIVALFVCLLVGLLCQWHGERVGHDEGLRDHHAHDAHTQHLTLELAQTWHALNRTLDAFDTQRALAERRFAELVEAEHARDSAERKVVELQDERVEVARIIHTADRLPTRIVSVRGRAS